MQFGVLNRELLVLLGMVAVLPHCRICSSRILRPADRVKVFNWAPSVTTDACEKRAWNNLIQEADHVIIGL